MPNIVSCNQMDIGKKGGGKHWTKEQVESRKEAAEKFTRKSEVKLKMPVWLDDGARRVWKKTLRDMNEFEVLDNVDADSLAIYCDAVARYQEATLKVRETGLTSVNDKGTESVSPYVKAAQSYARIVATYADKLGLNANARARLAKKKAVEEVNLNEDLFE